MDCHWISSALWSGYVLASQLWFRLPFTMTRADILSSFHRHKLPSKQTAQNITSRTSTLTWQATRLDGIRRAVSSGMIPTRCILVVRAAQITPHMCFMNSSLIRAAYDVRRLYKDPEVLGRYEDIACIYHLGTISTNYHWIFSLSPFF